MERPRVLWAGEAAGEHWELQLRDVYEGPLASPELESDEVLIEGTDGSLWHLLLMSRTGARLEVWWDPDRRIRGAQLQGWNKHAIGRVKRHLISIGRRIDLVR